MSNKNFYVTTPIYYPSGNLHIGHAYTTVLADVIARYKKENGYNVFFLTGSDEHGQKIETKAKEANLDPKKYVDGMIVGFKELWKKLDINFDRFIRTTDEDHVEGVKKIFTKLLKQDDIYLGEYVGKYCTSCEEFLTKEQMDENFRHSVCKNIAKDLSEETYMLRVSKYHKFLVKLFETNFLIPENRKSEMLNNFINNNLEDLSVTRVTFDWGIKINESDKHIIYVWLDALSNYITALGWGSDNDKLLKQFWSKDSEVLQIVGKEITRFHSIYWPVMLEGLGLKMPDKLLSHGWILVKNEKMSKSLGNVVDPNYIINTYGSDAVRFYISYNLPTENDGSYSDELMIESFNTNLANNIGNLISRVSNMIIKYSDGLLNKVDISKTELFKESQVTIKNFGILMDEYKYSKAIETVLGLGNLANKLIEDSKPWDLDKQGKKKELNLLLSQLQYAIVTINFLLKPILVKSYETMMIQMGVDGSQLSLSSLVKNEISFSKIKEKLIIFKRLAI
ncbi:methionyl-tRNA synthetase [Spiroplasma sp. TIUS-1]|uniref:methionine--tRNA ligase n=1 Tax=Spiroplasma sp. TIUS-1 TaxID=216963 RepID=UPI001396FF10|nr:methionine--tRNA ligase [Spiroplasma sp. TIUS-1]QHX36234.1 methionyl-tRNA synthetase [Spiroplasma sp. TIUS-1]